MEIFLFVLPTRYNAASQSQSACLFVSCCYYTCIFWVCLHIAKTYQEMVSHKVGRCARWLPTYKLTDFRLSSPSKSRSIQRYKFHGRPTDADSRKTSKSICMLAQFDHFLFLYCGFVKLDKPSNLCSGKKVLKTD